MDEISRAVEVLQAGGLVAFPTETVYGLGADARRSDAVLRIFAAKGRPATNPLIVHVSGVAMAKLYAAEWSDAARRLAQTFWPGPLTLVVPRYRTIAPEVSAHLPTVALRMPDHPLALQLIQRFDGPIAAPSANRSTRVSPTTAGHVRDELGDAVELILDGGACTVGIESTVLDLTARPRPVILRPGAIMRDQIERVIGPIELPAPIHTRAVEPAKSPGQQEIHYAPRTPAYRFEGEPPMSLDDARSAFILLAGETAARERPGLATLPDEPDAYARLLYAALRDLDSLGRDAIYVQMPPDEPAWLAVRDRLRRATRPT
jgi:L-threonylcarbamoyladenylate synthase